MIYFSLKLLVCIVFHSITSLNNTINDTIFKDAVPEHLYIFYTDAGLNVNYKDK